MQFDGAAVIGLARRVWAELPRGEALPPELWSRRHATIVAILWGHAAAVTAFAVATGNSLVHSMVEGGIIAVCALPATLKFVSPRWQSASASIGLVAASAVLVHLSGGYIEMHFHFFVMVALLALYQDWTPFLLAIGFVVIHHGVIGVLEPSAVYNHPSAWARPWTWAGIHGAFVLFASALSVVTWRVNERAQVLLRKSHAMLEQQAQQLTAKNEELDTFVYSVSHDLKAPLVTMQGMAGLLLDDYGAQLGERGGRYLRRLQANVEQMERLITDLLAISRIGRDGQRGEAVNLADVVDELMVEMTTAIEVRGAKIIVRDAATLWGARIHIQQVLRNLIGNAIKYAGDASPLVEIGAVDRGEFVECYVKDNGVGIDPAYHTKVFEMFHRLKEVEAEGTGLGLAIVKKIVESVGCRVGVESVRGEGATFRFTWPAMAAARTVPRPPSSAPARRAG